MIAARTNLTLGDLLGQNARAFPLHVAVVDGEVRLTWRELDERVQRLVTVLSERGVGSGDMVGWFGQNSFRVIELLLACARLEAVLCPVNWRQSAAELAFVLDDVDPKVVVWQQAEIGETIEQARHVATASPKWICHDGDAASEYEAALAAASPATGPVMVDPAQPVVMFYTAAFEGRPNGALLSHRAWMVQNLMTAIVHDINADSVYLNSGPLFHVGTFRHTLATLQFAGTNVFVRRVDAAELCRVIERERCTGAFLERPTIDQMVEHNRTAGHDLSSLRVPSGADGWNEMVTVVEPKLSSGFGQTEVAGVVTFRGLGGSSIGGAGRPSPVAEVQIVDAQGEPVPAGTPGEIVVRGPVVMNGYHRRPELNQLRSRGGWHHTNDLGKQEADGSFTFVGPATRIIKSASENIYPAEVEGCLVKHPAVAAAGVIGVPDAVWGQSVLAVVTLDEGTVATEEDLIRHCRSEIASYKKPRRIEFVDELPRTSSGGIDHEALDERFGGGGYPSSL